MTDEHQTCVKKILGNIEKFVLVLFGLGFILVISLFFLLPKYMQYNYMQECIKENHSEDWCKNAWTELQKMD